MMRQPDGQGHPWCLYKVSWWLWIMQVKGSMPVSRCNCRLDTRSSNCTVGICYKKHQDDFKAIDTVQVLVPYSKTGSIKVLQTRNLVLLHRYLHLQILLLTEVMAAAARPICLLTSCSDSPETRTALPSYVKLSLTSSTYLLNKFPKHTLKILDLGLV